MPGKILLNLVTHTRMGESRGDTEEYLTADDSFSVCLSELEGYLHKVHVALGAYLNLESTDNIIYKLNVKETINCDAIVNG